MAKQNGGAQAVATSRFSATWLGRIWKTGSRWLPGPRERRIEVLDRIALTHQHSIHLIAVEGRWLALGVSSKELKVLDSGNLRLEAPPERASDATFREILQQGASL